MSNRQLEDGRRRLSILYHHLGTVKEEEFNIRAWNCGTVCCAVGHGTCCEELRKDGLYADRNGTPMFDFDDGWDAVQNFFDLCMQDALDLFWCHSPEDQPTLSDVRERIKNHLAKAGVHVMEVAI